MPATALREASMLCALKSPHVVRLHNVLLTAEHLGLVLADAGQTLGTVLDAAHRELPLDMAARAMCQLLRGLLFCHARDVVHRDLKPSNILVSQRGVLRICDFGNARQLSIPTLRASPDMGSLWFRAPELLLGDDLYSAAVDLWAAGCILGELVHGAPPFTMSTWEAQAIVILAVTRTTPGTWPALFTLPRAQQVLFPVGPLPSSSMDLQCPARVAGSLSAYARRGPPQARALLHQLMACDPNLRLCAGRALAHPWLASMSGCSLQEVLLHVPSRSCALL